ncbi:D-alanyl-D-alanine carboxypeptidase-like protein [Neorhizobium sp. R1-B]|nr:MULTISPECIES: M15 family metallopeptidase [unclassified Neorhizobium]TCV59372.1 D-alanyl-D-alanine carboxypeptidase-like protein [Neorhizobium sp. S3-V5DH]TDX71980.1 D-alanyl-D-alanine carboxypeptidase-like protein [Neorhizobium sp. R1-B]
MSSPHQRDVDTAHLHPAVRKAARLIVEELNTEGFPFRIFEAFRSPQRQEFLYAQGRTRPGPIVTKARPWRSYHQYGLAIDLVLFVNGQWS